MTAKWAVLVCALFFSLAHAEEAPAKPDGEKKKFAGYQVDTEDKSKGQVIIPYALYNTETSLAFGIVLLNYFQLGDDADTAKPSVFRVYGQYTLKNQVKGSVGPEFYLANGLYKLGGSLGYSYYPDTFYGVGPNSTISEPYTLKTFGFNTYFKKQFLEGLRAGPTFEVSDVDMTTTPGGVLASHTITGSRGGLVSGLGFDVTYDQRDVSFFPRHGYLYDASITFFGPMLGSAFSWEKYFLDLRHYFPLWSRQVFAAQFYLQYNHGNPPFTSMAQMGGDKIMRGYVQGQYRDLTLGAVQVEYRAPLFWRLGGDLFANLGNVGDTPLGLFRTALKPTGGFGLRLDMDPKQNINARLDVGFSRLGYALHMNIEEAF